MCQVEYDENDIKGGKMQYNFPERLKSAREKRNLTQNELGQKAGLPPSSIAHFETGSRKPSLANLRRIAIALEVTTDYLLERVDDFTLVENKKQGEKSIFRDIENLSAKDLEFAKQMLRALAERNEKNEL